MSYSKPIILVTGAESQLGKTLRMFPDSKDRFNFIFKNKYTLDIKDKSEVKKFFKEHKIDYCFNFAAYTNVTQAETDKKKCFEVNVKGVANLAKAAKKHDFTLVHISTDYVFDGQKQEPYIETDKENPLNIYGKTKFLGELTIEQHLKKYVIVRTSWLYSKFNKNFVKTVLELSKLNRKLKLINDQTGTPTYANDLVQFLLLLTETIENNPKKNYFGTYHFSNQGEATWYDFGKKILEYAGINKKIKPIDTSRFDNSVKRPAYSVLSKNKIKDIFDYKPQKWETALKDYFL